jgi:SP family general alpha glucoside:H+ symporter-like MFS transporter
MTTEKIVPTDRELQNIELNNPDVLELTRQAEASDAADRLLTVRQALAKYKKAVFWAMFLSTSLIMEGYDLVIVSILLPAARYLLTNCPDYVVLWPVAVC